MSILLIRHGEAVCNVDPAVGSWHDPGLTDKGREEATALARRLKESLSDIPFKLYSSHRKRAVETAEIIGEYLGVAPILDPELEGFRHGFDPEVSTAEAKKYEVERCSPVKDWRPYRDGESFGEVFLRASRTIDKIDGYGDRLSVVVSHSMIIDKMVSHWIGLKLDDLQPFVFKTGNTGITLLTYRHGERILERLNDTAHLGEYLDRGFSQTPQI